MALTSRGAVSGLQGRWSGDGGKLGLQGQQFIFPDISYLVNTVHIVEGAAESATGAVGSATGDLEDFFVFPSAEVCAFDLGILYTAGASDVIVATGTGDSSPFGLFLPFDIGASDVSDPVG